MFTQAITRLPGPNFSDGLTLAGLGAPDYELILQQHATYVKTLRECGLEVIELAPLPAHPDAYFVEDPALITPEIAVITLPGAISRRGEQESLAEVLREYRPLEFIISPGTVDGGDVLAAGSHYFIGLSERTNPAGAGQLGGILERYGYTWSTVQVGAGLHLKSDVNYLGSDVMLCTSRFEDHDAFADFSKIVVDDEEAYAANSLQLNAYLLTPAGFPNTLHKLDTAGFEPVELDVSEVRKMDGGLTCMSLRF